MMADNQVHSVKTLNIKTVVTEKVKSQLSVQHVDDFFTVFHADPPSFSVAHCSVLSFSS